MEVKLVDSEWERVQLLLSLLAQAEKAQHTFSAEQGPTMHAILPALESLFKAWSLRKNMAKYGDFTDALDAGLNKISEYYEQTATSDAHIIVMLLDPAQKLNHIHLYWGEELLDEAIKHNEVIISVLSFLLCFYTTF
ncbi:hypothetical protein PISMIDRAFT_114786 [Pisolithus microcarpus 441]|uniref:Uncharacterized protein n=1 Tax=Pisolithus microcarpus 441 TaxID=765257 RepID=A0A0C9YZW2_9AGAM|nr:hypothetical protein PISMIDRAFT_114786 [Pisolithus microcarpus 441]